MARACWRRRVFRRTDPQFAFIPARYSAQFLAATMPIPAAGWREAVPFVSYMALHNDFTHLAINSLWLLAFGPIVARRFGGLLFLLFFLVCGLAGALRIWPSTGARWCR